MRVFVNDKAVEVPRGARVRDAVAQADDGLARLLDGAAYVTDAAGRTIDAGDAVGEAGSVYRVVVSARGGREGKPRLTKDVLRRWPKAELHVHLDGALRPATMLDLARLQGIRLPADTPDALAKAMLVRDAKNLEEYLQKYEITLSVLQTAAALERVAYEFVIDKAAENLRYVEVRYSPLLHRPALTLAQAIEAPLAGIRRASAETGTKVGLIVCAMRTKPPAESLELARVAAEYHAAGVTAFDWPVPSADFRRRSIARRSSTRRRTAWPAPAMPVRETAPTRSIRRSTTLAPSGSGTGRGSRKMPHFSRK